MRDKTISLRKDNVQELIEEGWQSAQDGNLDDDEFFDRLDAELEAMERNASK